MTAPTILIPGIKGTTLVNTNTLDFDTIWSGIQSKFETIYDLSLSEDPRFEAEATSIIERSDVEDLAYREAVTIIERKTQSDIYIFGYDWRRSCAENGSRLFRYVNYLKEKLSVRKFNFLTHSMGGMVFSCFLKHLKGNYDVIDRAALTVCPFGGSVAALVALLVGEGGYDVPLFNSNDEFRKIARTFPSVYELCPIYPGAVRFESGKKFNLYNKDHWQSNLARLPIFQDRLIRLKKFRNKKNPAMLPLDSLPANVRRRLLILIGTNEDTPNHVIVRPEGPTGRVKNFFDFEQDPGDGDGTVPVESATMYKDSVLTLSVESRWYDMATHGFFLNDGRVQTVIHRFFRKDVRYPQWWSDLAGKVNQVK